MLRSAVVTLPRWPVPVTLISTAQGTHRQAFGPTEWGLLAFVAGVWGSSFLLIAIGLDAFAPGVVTFRRILFGMLGLAAVPAARVPIDREDWPRVALVGLTWMALPLSLFPIAQRYVDSSVAGMINGSVPLFTALIAAVLLQTSRLGAPAIGPLVGFGGVVAISLPSLHGADASPLGRRPPAGRGRPLRPVGQPGRAPAAEVRRAAGDVAGAALRPGHDRRPTAWPASRLGFGWASLAAVVVLGFLGTGWAFVAMTNLMGRAGAARGSVAIYLTPVVAIALGVVFRDETVAGLALVGMVLVLLGAWLTSRADEPDRRQKSRARLAASEAE